MKSEGATYKYNQNNKVNIGLGRILHNRKRRKE